MQKMVDKALLRCFNGILCFFTTTMTDTPSSYPDRYREFEELLTRHDVSMTELLTHLQQNPKILEDIVSRRVYNEQTFMSQEQAQAADEVIRNFLEKHAVLDPVYKIVIEQQKSVMTALKEARERNLINDQGAAIISKEESSPFLEQELLDYFERNPEIYKKQNIGQCTLGESQKYDIRTLDGAQYFLNWYKGQGLVTWCKSVGVN